MRLATGSVISPAVRDTFSLACLAPLGESVSCQFEHVPSGGTITPLRDFMHCPSLFQPSICRRKRNRYKIMPTKIARPR